MLDSCFEEAHLVLLFLSCAMQMTFSVVSMVSEHAMHKMLPTL